MYINKFIYQSCVSYNFINHYKNSGKKKNNANGLKQHEDKYIFIFKVSVNIDKMMKDAYSRYVLYFILNLKEEDAV